MTLVTPLAGRRPRPVDRRARTAAIIFALAVHLLAILALVLAIAPLPVISPAPSVVLTLAPPPVPPRAPMRLGGASAATARKRSHPRSLRPRPTHALLAVVRPRETIPILPVPAPTLDAPKDVDLASPAVGLEVGVGVAGSGAGPGVGIGSGSGRTASDVGATEPVWDRRPTRAQARAAYPHAAYLAGLAGAGRLRCRIRADGRVDRCVVIEEAPPGDGFGRAALELSREFRFHPSTLGGRPQDVFRTIPFAFDVTQLDAAGSGRRR